MLVVRSERRGFGVGGCCLALDGGEHRLGGMWEVYGVVRVCELWVC